MNMKQISTVLVAIGLLAAVTATYKSIGYMETNQFCGQCHEMKSWVRSLREDQTLAGKHHEIFEEREEFNSEKACIACHYEPGISGFIETKLKGASEAYIHFFENVNPAEISGGVSRAICFKCHEISKLKESHKSKLDGKNCVSCHVTGHDSFLAFHFENHEQLTEIQMDRVKNKNCSSCHGKGSTELHEALEEDCSSCH
ncbi:hypothetical protein AKJ62_04290, partial [candidate division MSBL1 archaeon SCGC-AAA259D14]